MRNHYLLNRCILFTMYLFVFYIKGESQVYNKTPEDSVAIIEEKLVQLALKQPQYYIGQYETNIAEAQLKQQRNSWLDLLTISANYNDQTFAKQSNNTAYVYPKYFFGITLPVGSIVSRGGQIQVAKENVKISQKREEELERTIRADVLAKYTQYRTYEKLLALQNQAVNDEQALYLQVEQKFRDGSVLLADYTNATKNLNAEIVKQTDLQMQLALAKIDLEKIIGIKLEAVLR